MSEERWIIFSGPITDVSVRPVSNALAILSQADPPISCIHLGIHTTGGSVPDGIFLYNVFKAHSPKLSLYNMGAVQSIGAIAFLGGNRRFVSSSATFMFHRTTSVPQQANLERLKYLAKSVASDDRITEGILRKHLNMGDEMWACLDQNDLLVSAEQAVEIGLAHEVREFLPPVGTKIISIQS